MSCCSQLLTGGIACGTCESNTGGVMNIYLTDHCNIVSVTEDEEDSEITAITMASATQFYEFCFTRDSASLAEPATISLQNGTIFYNGTIAFTVSKRDLVKRKVVAQLANRKLVGIIKDQNEKYWLVGRFNGLELTAQEGGTGAAKGDLNGYVITLTAEEPQMAFEIDSTIISALI